MFPFKIIELKSAENLVFVTQPAQSCPSTMHFCTHSLAVTSGLQLLRPVPKLITNKR